MKKYLLFLIVISVQIFISSCWDSSTQGTQPNTNNVQYVTINDLSIDFANYNFAVQNGNYMDTNQTKVPVIILSSDTTSSLEYQQSLPVNLLNIISGKYQSGTTPPVNTFSGFSIYSTNGYVVLASKDSTGIVTPQGSISNSLLFASGGFNGSILMKSSSNGNVGKEDYVTIDAITADGSKREIGLYKVYIGQSYSDSISEYFDGYSYNDSATNFPYIVPTVLNKMLLNTVVNSKSNANSFRSPGSIFVTFQGANYVSPDNSFMKNTTNANHQKTTFIANDIGPAYLFNWQIKDDPINGQYYSFTLSQDNDTSPIIGANQTFDLHCGSVSISLSYIAENADFECPIADSCVMIGHLGTNGGNGDWCGVTSSDYSALITDSSGTIFTGYTYQINSSNSNAASYPYSIVQANAIGQNYYNSSVDLVAQHEILHQFGAIHNTSTPNIMTVPSVSPMTTQTLELTWQQVQKYMENPNSDPTSEQ